MRSQEFPLKVLILVTFVTAACTQSTVNFQTRWQGFLNHLDRCTAEHGYDPAKAKHLGENELGKNEKAWRRCAYAGIEGQMIPGALDPKKFQRLVHEDQVMTEQIAQGTLTRSLRKARVQEVLGQIKNEEDAYHQEQIRKLNQMQDHLERHRRFQDLHRRITETNNLRGAAASKF